MKKFKDFIVESLKSESLDSMLLYKQLNTKFDGDIIVDRPYDEYLETIDIRIKNTDIFDKLFRYIKKNNWYVSKNYNTSIVIKPIYSNGIVENIPQILYHVTPTKNIKKILKKGLISKSENIRDKYPNRIYFTRRLGTAEQFIIELKRWKGNEEYSIIEIDTTELNCVFYKDIASIYFGCYYIQNENIKTEYLSVVEKNDL